VTENRLFNPQQKNDKEYANKQQQFRIFNASYLSANSVVFDHGVMESKRLQDESALKWSSEWAGETEGGVLSPFR